MSLNSESQIKRNKVATYIISNLLTRFTVFSESILIQNLYTLPATVYASVRF